MAMFQPPLTHHARASHNPPRQITFLCMELQALTTSAHNCFTWTEASRRCRRQHSGGVDTAPPINQGRT